MAFTSTVVEQDRDLFLIARGNRYTGSTHWEVWRIQAQRAHTLPDGTVVPEGLWRPPLTKEWGTHGWTYTRLTDALEKWVLRVGVFAERPAMEPAKHPLAPHP